MSQFSGLVFFVGLSGCFLFVDVASIFEVVVASSSGSTMAGVVVGSVTKMCFQCASCCVGDIWENSVGSGENGGGGVGGGLCSRFCGDGPSHFFF